MTEVTGVGTLPAARRRGIGAAVTGQLVEDARERGAELVFLSAADDDVARMYERLGFRRIATACFGRPPAAMTATAAAAAPSTASAPRARAGASRSPAR